MHTTVTNFSIFITEIQHTANLRKQKQIKCGKDYKMNEQKVNYKIQLIFIYLIKSNYEEKGDLLKLFL